MWYCRFMASRNALKVDIAEQYYHVYNRGVEKRTIFMNDKDYVVFLNLLKRHLDDRPHKDARGNDYKCLYKQIELVSFCLMPNHFHLQVYQVDPGSMTTLMQSICSSYTKYFNKKYKRVGPLFQGVYKASLIDDDAYVQHISRYIHLNPDNYRGWEYSSLPYFLGSKRAKWVMPGRMLEMFNGTEEYLKFLEAYEEQREVIDELKYSLANF